MSLNVTLSVRGYSKIFIPATSCEKVTSGKGRCAAAGPLTSPPIGRSR